MTPSVSPAGPSTAMSEPHSQNPGTPDTCRMDRGLMIGLAMFGDDQKTPPQDQPPAKAEDQPPSKRKEDAEKDAYQFTDWALI